MHDSLSATHLLVTGRYSADKVILLCWHHFHRWQACSIRFGEQVPHLADIEAGSAVVHLKMFSLSFARVKLRRSLLRAPYDWCGGSSPQRSQSSCAHTITSNQWGGGICVYHHSGTLGVNISATPMMQLWAPPLQFLYADGSRVTRFPYNDDCLSDWIFSCWRFWYKRVAGSTARVVVHIHRNLISLMGTSWDFSLLIVKPMSPVVKLLFTWDCWTSSDWFIFSRSSR